MHSASNRAARARQIWLILTCVLFAAAAAILSCSSGDRSLDAVDPNAVATHPTFDQVNAIVHNKCVTCHYTNSERYSSFETCADVVALAPDILKRVEDNTMPPGALPRLTSEEKLIIQRWVANGEPAPCN